MVEKKYFAIFAAIAMAFSLSACADQSASLPISKAPIQKTAVWVKKKPVVKASLAERECLARAMYFESNRSSTEGMLAVGSVVMNRVESGRYGDSICSVVGAPRQFAPGVLHRAMNDRSAPVVRKVAEEVLSGQRHSQVGNAMHFHMAGMRFPYNNMRYVTVAGGNAFYEKRDRHFMADAARLSSISHQSEPAPVQAAALASADRIDDIRSDVAVSNLSGTPLIAAETFQLDLAAIAPKPAATVQHGALRLSDAAPLPPRRPRQLGMTTPAAGKQAARTFIRVADSRTGTDQAQ